jgi:hypothetical protein
MPTLIGPRLRHGGFATVRQILSVLAETLHQSAAARLDPGAEFRDIRGASFTKSSPALTAGVIGSGLGETRARGQSDDYDRGGGRDPGPKSGEALSHDGSHSGGQEPDPLATQLLPYDCATFPTRNARAPPTIPRA